MTKDQTVAFAALVYLLEDSQGETNRLGNAFDACMARAYALSKEELDEMRAFSKTDEAMDLLFSTLIDPLLARAGVSV